jgi:hypothetical protein
MLRSALQMFSRGLTRLVRPTRRFRVRGLSTNTQPSKKLDNADDIRLWTSVAGGAAIGAMAGADYTKEPLAGALVGGCVGALVVAKVVTLAPVAAVAVPIVLLVGRGDSRPH